MNTVRKGDLFEARVYDILQSAINENRLALSPECCHLRPKAPYYSNDRKADIIFDLSIEVTPPGTDQIHILYLIECKNYGGRVPVSDVEEFISKIQQVAGLYVKGVFVTTTDLQEGGYNLLKSKNMMWIKVNVDNTDIILYNKQRNQPDQSDYAVFSLSEELEKLKEINDLFSMDDININTADWDLIIQQFISRELNAKVNWEQPGDKTEGLEFLSKKIITGISEQILSAFNPNVVARGNPLPLEDFMVHVTEHYGLQFVVDIPFEPEKSHLNGYYLRKDRTIFINPELQGSGQFTFVCVHEIAHFILHENLKISQTLYEEQEDSKYDYATGKYKLNKEKHWIEWQANYLAACLIMPEYSLMWQLINWQVNRGISKRGYIWVDNQPCNILDFKVAMVRLAFIFQVSTSVLEIRMRDLGIIKYQNKRRITRSMFGEGRSVRSIGNIMNSWMDKYLDNADDLDVQDL